MDKKIKWGCIQPLTGGMYIGAMQAIGHSAEWILSYDGLDAVKKDKEDNIVAAANEYNLRDWLKKNDLDVPYYVIKDRDMFAMDVETKNPAIFLNDEESLPDYEDIDLIVAVPVCSGLSNSTRASSDTKDARNCNMQWLAYYVLNVIKPKVYCFENAPTLVGDGGKEVRHYLENVAMKAGYSVLYYKTDTVYHHNCQRRPRTFVMFFKWAGEGMQRPPLLGYEHETILIPEFFDAISKDAPQQTPVRSSIHNYMVIDFMNYKYGEDWPSHLTKTNVVTHILNDKELYAEFREWIASSSYSDLDKERAFKYIDHIFYKKDMGKNYYSQDAALFVDLFPSVQFRSIPNMLHYSGKRFCTVREYLSLMGMPEDFILYGGDADLAKIGQNVPVGTAKFIVSQIVNVLNEWNYINREDDVNMVYQNNVKQGILKLN